MTKWLRRIRAAFVMGLTWAVVWAPLGILIGMIVDPNGAMDEPWVMVGTLPGFLGGVAFSVVLGIAASRRRLDQLSLARVGAWGAVAGLLVGLLPFALGDLNPGVPVWLPVVATGAVTLLSAVSAAGSLALARRAEKRELLDAGADVADVGLSPGDAQELRPGPQKPPLALRRRPSSNEPASHLHPNEVPQSSPPTQPAARAGRSRPARRAPQPPL